MHDKHNPSNRSGSLRVGETTLRFTIEGTGIPTLVLGSAVYYPRTFSPHLREAGRLAFVDLRHFAEKVSSNTDHINLDTYTDDIEQLRNEVGFDEFVLVGHSHHGNLALEYAKKHPAAVSHLVLIGSPPCDVKTTIGAANGYWADHASEARKTALRENWSALSSDTLEVLPAEAAYVAHYVADCPQDFAKTGSAKADWQNIFLAVAHLEWRNWCQ